MTKFREWLSSWLSAISEYVRPHHRPIWHGESPLPENALWLKCGHPSTDGSDEWTPMSLHGTVDAKVTLTDGPQFVRNDSYERMWCWWHQRWEELA